MANLCYRMNPPHCTKKPLKALWAKEPTPTEASSPVADSINEFIQLEAAHPYLKYGFDHLRDTVIDPATLPRLDSTCKLNILIIQETLSTGGAESLARSIAETLASRHYVTVCLSRIAALPTSLPKVSYRMVAGITNDLLSQPWDVILHNNGAGWVETQGQALSTMHVLAPYGLTVYNVKRLLTDNDPRRRVVWAYPGIAAPLLRAGLTDRAYDLHGGISMSKWKTARRRRGAVVNLGYVGRISTEKDVPAFCRLASALNALTPTQAYIIGGPDYMKHSPDEITAYQSTMLAMLTSTREFKETTESGLVKYVGHQTDMSSWYNRLDCLAFTSSMEGEAVAALEAMACGCVVASRDIGEQGRLLGSGRGVLSTSVNRVMCQSEIDEMANGISELWHQPAAWKATAAAGRKYVLENHTIQKMVDDLERIIQAEVLS